MLRGYRRYELTSIDGHWALAGMRMTWPTAQMTAECLAPQFTPSFDDPHTDYEVYPADLDRHALCVAHIWDMEESGHYGYGCGIYIVPEQRQLEQAVVGFGSVEVQTIGWGAVAEYEIGWRVEKARMEHILIDPHTTETVFARLRLSNPVAEVDKLFSDLGVRYGVYVSWLER